MPQPQKWSVDAIGGVAATPWSQHEAEKPEVIKLDCPGVSLPDQPVRIPVVWRAYIRQKDRDKYGYTQNCPCCQSSITYGPNTQNSTPHTDQCRQRIMDEWSKTE